ncbi:amidase [Rhodohalobacter barkolensis]|uniref:Amidase n=1 Tax=Rhodohalobacter barkolensis TaxID=2053187 RepID=A0A2N0VIK5_9BACT|nr:amidase [Rhodohalobacter barkolensis]PKD44030.1 amidase [Rhodohalobacter barkolensis]
MNTKLLIYSVLALLFISACSQSGDESLYELLDLEEITVDQLQERYDNGNLNASQVVRAYLDRIEEIDKNGPGLNAILTINPNALEIADSLDRERRDGNVRGPLHGVPIILKDNINTADMQTTAGSRFMEGSVPPEDAFIVKKLKDAGAIIIAKANLSEWANFHSNMSSSGWSGLGGQVNNPYDITRNPCGSSAGSGVAASANLATLTIGTETNGSIVCPSNANGIVGLKPTIGLWSRSGIIPISHTTDSAGPMVRTVRDAAILLSYATGVDPNDDKTADSEEHIHEDYTQFLNENGLEGKRIGFFTQPMGSHFRVDTLMNQTVRKLEELGAEVIEIDQISETNVGGDAFQVLLYEFKDGLNKYFESLGENAPVSSIEELAELTRENPEETERFDRNLIFMAAEKGDLDSEEYREALENMLLHSRDEGIDKVMDEENLDAFVSPTGSPAWKTDLTLGDNFALSSSSPSARAGYPIVTLPMGQLDGLPVGVSFFGRAWSEPVLLEIAYAFEQATNHRFVPEFND